MLPTLYLCGACAISRTEILEKLDVKLVVNATLELPDTPLPEPEPNYLRVPIKDTKESNLIEYFDQVADLIEEVSFRYRFFPTDFEIKIQTVYFNSN